MHRLGWHVNIPSGIMWWFPKWGSRLQSLCTLSHSAKCMSVYNHNNCHLEKRTINLSEMGGKEDFRLFSNAQLAPDQLRYLQIFFMEPAWVLSSSLFSIMNSISFNICSICIKIIWQNQQFALQFFKSFPSWKSLIWALLLYSLHCSFILCSMITDCFVSVNLQCSCVELNFRKK